jgi:hypothetical protein
MIQTTIKATGKSSPKTKRLRRASLGFITISWASAQATASAECSGGPGADEMSAAAGLSPPR